MSGIEYDAVIAGGGLSGLSLAAHLAAGGWHDHAVLLVDDSTAPAAACWAHWSARPGLLEPAVSRAYGRVRVHAAGESRTLALGPYRYRVVRRPDLSRVVRGLLEACPGFTVRCGHVTSVLDRGDAVEAIVDGRTVRARWGFDSVTVRPPGSAVDARLAFTGWEIRSARPAFDPGVPTLFDFRTRHADGARFAYVLPDDRHQALVELTEFVPRRAKPPTAAARREALASYLRDVLRLDDVEVLRAESAVLPLHAYPPRRAHGRVLAIGAAGGLVKASTGYAYERIQRDSRAIVTSLVRHGHPFDRPPERRRYRLLDALLLDVLDDDPAQMERAFARLFSANPADRVLRFLDEDTGWREEMRLFASLPPGPYARALATRCGDRLRAVVRGAVRPV